MKTPENTLDHIVCGMCPDEPKVYVCGTVRDEETEEDGTERPEHPCLVCFGSSHITCVECGHRLNVKKLVKKVSK